MKQQLATNIYDRLRAECEAEGIPLPTRQEVRFLELLSIGTPITIAANEVGFPRMHGKELLRHDHIQEVLEKLQQYSEEENTITKHFVTGMLLESHKLAATATEQIMAAKELGKLWDVYESDRKARKTQTNIQNTLTQINNIVVNNRKQIEAMTDEDLLKLAAMQLKQLDPVHPSLLDAQYDEVRDI